MARLSRLLTTAALAGAFVLAASGTPAAASRPPKLQYQISTLPNGLTVVLSEDHSTPIVHVNLTYHVGSKNEKAGRTGFAHLFEHLGCKGSKNVQPEAHTSMLAAIGGQSNAYTTDDETVFWETVPAHYLPLTLWLEADRMATLRIDKDTFESEREVVKEERRMRIDNQPYGRLNEIIYDQAFTVHPYKHATIGSMADLEAASVDDVRDFYQTYHVTKDGNPDSYPLHIAAKVLSDGQTSRIYKKLVYEKQMAVAAFGNANLIEDPNLFYAVAIVQPGHSTDEVTNALIAELDRLKTEPITEHELQRTKNQFARDYIFGRLS